MLLFRVLAGFSFIAVIMAFFVSFTGMSDAFPQTTQKAQEMTAEFDSKLAQSQTQGSSNPVQAVVDVLGSIAAGMITVFRVAIGLPSLLITFFYELFTILNFPYSNVISVFFGWLVTLASLYYFVLILEWIRTGFTRMV